MARNTSPAVLDDQSPLCNAILPLNLLAGPAKPNLPVPVAICIVLASLCAPILFLSAGGASPLLGIAIMALAAAGVIAAFGAVNARRRVMNDARIRIRARIGAEGITLYKEPPPSSGQFFPVDQIASVRLFRGSLVVLTTDNHPAPGRHALRFGKAVNLNEQILAALAALKPPS